MIKIDDKDFNILITYIKKNYGINLSNKRNLIEGRLSNEIINKGFNNFHDYLDFVFVDKKGTEVVALINKITTNHTFFMREAEHFEYFKKTVLPYIEKVKRNKDLRLWSAGCSSGEEPYTIAMLIDEYFKGEIKHWDSTILATDISTKVLDQAKKGVFQKEAVEKLPSNYRMKYFDQLSAQEYKVKQDIAKKIIFRKFNLMTTQFPFKNKFDVIFCRNVMIYFEKDVKMKLINKYYDNLAYGGYLFIGQAESIPRNETDFKYIMPAVYRKV